MRRQAARCVGLQMMCAGRKTQQGAEKGVLFEREAIPQWDRIFGQGPFLLVSDLG